LTQRLPYYVVHWNRDDSDEMATISALQSDTLVGADSDSDELQKT
jgi:hypothetical protein